MTTSSDAAQPGRSSWPRSSSNASGAASSRRSANTSIATPSWPTTSATSSPRCSMMEDLGESSAGTTGSLAADNGAAVGVRLQRLGDYRILREIGRGGMGVVYEAEQESLGRRVALKVLSRRVAARPQAGAAVRARGEGRGQAASHQHRAGLRRGPARRSPLFRDAVHRRPGTRRGAGRPAPAPAAGSPRRSPRLAVSRIAGLTAADVARSLLTGRFAADGPPARRLGDRALRRLGSGRRERPPGRLRLLPAILPGSSELSASSDPDRQFYRSVARIGVQVAEALEYANRQGILHRDVKPSNLLLDNHGNVWVADFGLAKTAEADDLTHTGDILGTIRYMAPERFPGKCDARSDVYSLGLTLYELLALRPAFEASDRHTLMERVLHEEPERLKKLAPGVPRDLETIIAKATARDPAGRYATAAALAEDLRRFVEDRPIRRGGCPRRSGCCGGAGGTRCWRARSAWRPWRWWPWPYVAALRQAGKLRRTSGSPGWRATSRHRCPSRTDWPTTSRRRWRSRTAAGWR